MNSNYQQSMIYELLMSNAFPRTFSTGTYSNSEMQYLLTYDDDGDPPDDRYRQALSKIKRNILKAIFELEQQGLLFDDRSYKKRLEISKSGKELMLVCEECLNVVIY